MVNIPTPAGPRPFAVAAVYFDYSSDRGVIAMDRGTFARHFGELAPTGLTVYLQPGADPEQVRAELLRSHRRGQQRVFVYTNRGLRAEVLRIFDARSPSPTRSRSSRSSWRSWAWPARC